MASFNKVILMGNLTRDPELRTAPSGAKVCDFSLAISENWLDKSTGQTREVVCYVDVNVWNRAAENCAQYLAKGRGVLVEGRLQMDQWTTQQGEKRSRLRVRADTVQFLPQGQRREDGAAPAAPQPAASAPMADAPISAQPISSVDDPDDLPF
ncbi:MAG: single-stranded DNA-binding protein [Kiritimatiellae bacterium]|nr:single-stranded DNA-binding protein [Kiritimatiellia bacterium]